MIHHMISLLLLIAPISQPAETQESVPVILTDISQKDADMITPASLSENLMYSTVRIKVITKDKVGSGTGFLVEIPIDERLKIIALITNNHVIRDAQTLQVPFHTQKDGKPTGQVFGVTIPGSPTAWTRHPNPDIDLCACNISQVMEAAKKRGTPLFIRTIDASIIPSEEQLKGLFAVEDVLMVGYPKGLWDELHNYPLMRRGITATHPAVDFKGKSEMVIDAACFPGSSGSPVLILDQGAYATKNGTIVGTRILLLGVLARGPAYDNAGKIKIVEIPIFMASDPAPPVMINLGYIIKAKEVLVLMESMKDAVLKQQQAAKAK